MGFSVDFDEDYCIDDINQYTQNVTQVSGLDRDLVSRIKSHAFNSLTRINIEPKAIEQRFSATIDKSGFWHHVLEFVIHPVPFGDDNWQDLPEGRPDRFDPKNDNRR
jgi:hypothetical protein